MTQRRRTISTPAAFKALEARLARSEVVSQLNSEGREESTTLAHAFMDLEESFIRFLDQLLPNLFKAESDEEVREALWQLGQEFRHILYHIRDPESFRDTLDDYLRPTKDS